MSVFESRVENYELPDSWGSGRLDEVCDQMKQGKILPQKEIHEIGRYPVFGANGCIGYCDSYFLEEERVLITCRGSTCGTINRSPEKSFVTNNAMILFEKDCLNKDFLFFALQEFSTKGLKTGSGQPQLTKGILNSHVLPLPPLPEQKKIAHILSTVQRAIEAQERIIQTTTELKKTLMHKLFTEGTRGEPQKQTEIGPVPGSWEVSLLGNSLLVAQYGLSVKGATKGDYPILRMTNQVDGQIVGNNLQFVKIGEADFKKFKVEKGDILFNRTNSLDLVGRTAIHDIDGNYVFASYLIRLRTDRKKLNPFFLNLYFNRDETQSRLKSIATRAVSQSNISATKLKGFPIPLPSTKEQTKIVTQTEAIETKLLLHRRKLESLQNLFRTLLHELMTAKIRVRDLNFQEK